MEFDAYLMPSVNEIPDHLGVAYLYSVLDFIGRFVYYQCPRRARLIVTSLQYVQAEL